MTTAPANEAVHDAVLLYVAPRLAFLRIDRTAYLDGIGRPGEYWMAATHRTDAKAGFECIVTRCSSAFAWGARRRR